MFGFGQLTTSVQPAGSLVQNVLLGPGVSVSNINYSGSSSAIGSFTANANNFGLNSGIVITTGTVTAGGNGPQGPNNQPNSGQNNSLGGYSQLSNLIGGATTYDASILEFDFVPMSDSIKFRYIFGSEEYPEYVGSQFNDVFAFFIAGPGISGLKNIALIPGTTTPVAINNVNGGNPPNSIPASNPAYYVYNGTGTNSPYQDNNQYIQYDGFTKVLTAKEKVNCGQTYHLIIAIADVGDGIFDSGIFLEANSLTSKLPIEVDYAMSNNAFGDNVTMAEGCVSTTVTVSRDPSDVSTSLNIPISLSGTATELVDYSDIPSSITIPAGQSSASFTFNALADGLTEGVETLNMIFHAINACNQPLDLPLNLKIGDIEPVEVTIEN